MNGALQCLFGFHSLYVVSLDLEKVDKGDWWEKCNSTPHISHILPVTGLCEGWGLKGGPGHCPQGSLFLAQEESFHLAGLFIATQKGCRSARPDWSRAKFCFIYSAVFLSPFFFSFAMWYRTTLTACYKQSRVSPAPPDLRKDQPN